MNLWKFFDITHREHVLCNPLSEEKLEYLMGLLRLEQGARILDIATGKAEFPLRLAERYGVSGTAIDLSPLHSADGRRNLESRAPGAQIEFIEMNAAEYTDQPESFDLVACLGASWIYGGFAETLSFLQRMAKLGGYVISGEPFWKKTPSQEYLDAIDQKDNSYGTHGQNVRTGEQLGLTLLYTLVSNDDDWDRYEGLQWYAGEHYAQEHPDDPDVPKLLRRIRKGKYTYLNGGRDCLGWAVYLFQKPMMK